MRVCIVAPVPDAAAWNLFDIDAKFGDVEPVATCVDYLDTVNRRAATQGEEQARAGKETVPGFVHGAGTARRPGRAPAMLRRMRRRRRPAPGWRPHGRDCR